MRPGPRNLITDVAGIRVGQARDDRVKSGVTVVTGPAPFVAGVHVMGGAPGTRETDLLAPHRTVAAVDALVLAGGSAFGLDAAAGVMEGLAAVGRGHAIGPVAVPIVPAAIVFDLLNGGAKDWLDGRGANPYRSLGRAAFDASGPVFAIGSEGAGTGAMTATSMGGLGSASLVLGDGVSVGALAVVNAAGSAIAPGSRAFWAAPFEIDGEFGGIGAPPPLDLSRPLPRKPGAPVRAGVNTTLAVVATDARLDKAGATRLAEAAQDGLARALVPAHTPYDGDLVFAAATGSSGIDGADPERAFLLGHAAALCLARAVARGVHAARPSPGNLLPCWCEPPA
jgi:D-aminopeptidase